MNTAHFETPLGLSAIFHMLSETIKPIIILVHAMRGYVSLVNNMLGVCRRLV